MPILWPNGRGAPNGWQWAQDAFSKLIRLGTRAGEPVNTWHLSFPSRMESFKGIQWRLYYTERGQPLDIFVGWDGRSVADTINRSIIPTMRRLAEARTAELNTERAIHDELIEQGKVKDPIYDSHFAKSLLDAWRKGTAQLRSREDLERFKRSNKHLMDLLNKQAGVLPISMLQYLTRHPDAKHWPNPPETKEEWYQRHPEKRPQKKERQP